MNKRIKYFKNPEIIKQYQNSDYTDERHYAVSRFLAAAGHITENCCDFQCSLRKELMNAISDSVKNSEEHKGIMFYLERLYFEYIKMIYTILPNLALLDIKLPNDIKKTVLKTTDTAEYVIMLFLGF